MHIVLSGVLQKHAQYQREHAFAAETVQQAIDILVKSFPAMNNVLLDPHGQLRRIHRLFLNGKQLAHDETGQFVQQQDRLEILTAIAGG